MSVLHEPEVREFYYKMVLLEDGGISSKFHEIEINLTEEILRIILDVPCQRIMYVEGCKPSMDHISKASKYENMKCAGVPMKFLKGEHQLYFEFVNKVLLPRSEK
ncbi:hypothetical protein KY290_013696 [Solanum tuberosum]|uniref:Uncharacterized protein n=1 Tax=Solanum tuberosum TaxID=4113 RepID=A0ABQ7VN47_SOLTU|nr:hypothetical protein KY289_013813 [Solanum tuberosum]KAH0769715.1 hypothetical protein KY290_013696 [Solanum tuberosum]